MSFDTVPFSEPVVARDLDAPVREPDDDIRDDFLDFVVDFIAGIGGIFEELEVFLFGDDDDDIVDERIPRDVNGCSTSFDRLIVRIEAMLKI